MRILGACKAARVYAHNRQRRLAHGNGLPQHGRGPAKVALPHAFADHCNRARSRCRIVRRLNRAPQLRPRPQGGVEVS